MCTYRSRVALVLLLALLGTQLVIQPAASAEDVSGSATTESTSGSNCSSSDQSDCGGACSTCPGKARAIAGLAGKAKLVLNVGGMTQDADAEKIRSGLDVLDGVEISVANLSQGMAWIAYNPAETSPATIKKQIMQLGYSIDGIIGDVAPLPELAKGHERCVVYVANLREGDNTSRICGAVDALAGVDGSRLDLMWYMLLVDYDPGKTNPEVFKQQLLELGYAAGLPGETISFPGETK